MKRLLPLIATIWCTLTISAQSNASNDTLSAKDDSLVRELRMQIQELKLQSILMQERLEDSGKSAREDSLRQALRRARIDSLRNIIQGVPLVVEGDTLFRLYDRKGGMMPEERVQNISEAIMESGKSIKLIPDSVYVFEGDYTTDIMAGNNVIMSVTDNDAIWQNTTRQELGAQYCVIIRDKINDLHDEYGMQQKLKGLLYAAVILLTLFILIRITNWCYRRWRLRIVRFVMKRVRPLTVKYYEVLNMRRIGIVFLTIFNVLRYIIIFLLLFFCIPILFSIFPETESLAYRIIGYVWNPFVSIVKSVIGFLPKFIQIVVIIICFRYLVKGIRYLMNEIGAGRLKITGFYADWAEPTYFILRVLCYSFMIVMIWPLLPSSNSEVFQGVSVFIGIIVSLGSSSIIGNVMAGMVMTYMRPFHVGDFIKYGDTEGFVIEKTMLVTRIRTRKNNVITIPNSSLMTSQTTNYTFSAQNFGLVVHTKVTIGYDVRWQEIRQLLLDAAHATKGLRQHPEPFVLVTALDDYYVEYEVNAYTNQYDKLPIIYSELHHNILDSFHSNGVEIMSPHIYAHRTDLELQIPKDQQKPQVKEK
ncbi:MAG: mechanosensitive ion channel family protein [Prevotella sp.]|nr:mechanosensitive ion channel family protein [Prevotella sp.]